MKPTCAFLAAFAVCAASPAAAHADLFHFSFGNSTSQFSGSGTLTGTLSSPGEYTITAITGTTDTGNGRERPITGLDPNLFDDADYLLFVDSKGIGTFDVFGLSYELRNGALINLSTDVINGDTELLERVNGAYVTEFDKYTVVPTPEPGSFLLLATGLLGTAGLARRRSVI